MSNRPFEKGDLVTGHTIQTLNKDHCHNCQSGLQSQIILNKFL